MALYKGDKEITKIYKGDQEISKIYKGDNLYYENNVPFPNYLRKVSYLEGNFTGLVVYLTQSVDTQNTIISTSFNIVENPPLTTTSSYISFGENSAQIFVGYRGQNALLGVFNLRPFANNLIAELSTQTKYTLLYENKKWTLNGSEVSADEIRNLNIDRIFFATSHGILRLYGFEIKKASTNRPVIKLIPCLNLITGTPCFYNEASKRIIKF